MSREISCVHRARKLGTREVRRAFLVMVLELSLFQTGVNLVSAATQISMAGLAMYPLTAAVLLAFMRRQIASARVVLGERTLVLERRLGDRESGPREPRVQGVGAPRADRRKQHGRQRVEKHPLPVRLSPHRRRGWAGAARRWRWRACISAAAARRSRAPP